MLPVITSMYSRLAQSCWICFCIASRCIAAILARCCDTFFRTFFYINRVYKLLSQYYRIIRKMSSSKLTGDGSNQLNSKFRNLKCRQLLQTQVSKRFQSQGNQRWKINSPHSMCRYYIYNQYIAYKFFVHEMLNLSLRKKYIFLLYIWSFR